MRQGPYKLIENFDDGSLELYQLEDDLSETKNLAESEHEKASLMAARLRAWRDSSGARLPRSEVIEDVVGGILIATSMGSD